MRLKGIILSIIVTLWPAVALAHPHAWIYTKSEVVFDAKKRIKAIRQYWTFDPYYSETILYEFRQSKPNADTDTLLLELAGMNLKHLKPYHYFTEIKLNGKRLTTKDATDVKSRLEGKEIVMRFTLPLSEPVTIDEEQKFTYRIFDPSYFVEMLHIKKTDITITGGNDNCTTKLQHPDPTMEQTTLAQSLDRNAKAPASLGSAFAQTVHVLCH